LPLQTYHDRRGWILENDLISVVLLEDGGHIAAVIDQASGINPLWQPPWPSIEPSTFGVAHETLYGSGADARLLAGIMGHNLCLDIFGGPSDEEAAEGLTAHGEGSVTKYHIEGSAAAATMTATFPLALVTLQRQVELQGRWIRVRESVEHHGRVDRPIGWTQHVTLGPPYLERGTTVFRLSATRSKVFPGPFGPADDLEQGAEFDWPLAPLKGKGEGTRDLRLCNAAAVSSAYTAHLLDPALEDAYFVAYSPSVKLAFGYLWRRADFPWAGIWEENSSRAHTPWNGRTLTRAVEFGVSPFPESRREMVDRGRLFGERTFRWLPARARVAVEYWIVLEPADAIPERLTRPRA
jgi:hypothetical protein